MAALFYNQYFDPNFEVPDDQALCYTARQG